MDRSSYSGYHPGASADPFASAVGEALGGYQTGRQMQRENRMDLEAQEERRLRMQMMMDQFKIFKDRAGYGDPTGLHSGAAGQASVVGGGAESSVDIGPSPDLSQGPGVIQETPTPEAPQAVGPGQVAFPQGQPQMAERGVMGRIRELGGRVGRGVKERFSSFNSGGFQPFEPGAGPVKTHQSVEEIAAAAQERQHTAGLRSAEGIAGAHDRTNMEIAQLQARVERMRISAQIDERQFNEISRAIQYYGQLNEQAGLFFSIDDQDPRVHQILGEAQSIKEWIARRIGVTQSAQEIGAIVDPISTRDDYTMPPAPSSFNAEVGRNIRPGARRDSVGVSRTRHPTITVTP